MEDITFTINGKEVSGKPGNTIIEVAKRNGIHIPTLCYDPNLDSYGACRVCLVEDEKRGNLLASCVTPISNGLSILTDSKKVLDARRVVVKLMIANHPESCIVCEKGNRCQLRQIAADLGIGLVEYYPMPNFTGTRELNPFILRDLSKCILCAKCIRADHELVVEGAIDYLERGFEARPATLTDGPLEISECTFCGTCVEMCPTGALFERGKRYRGTPSQRTATTCSFCGCGCSFWLEVSNNQVVGVRPGIPGSVNGMTLCAKGHYGYDFINNPDRLQKPLVRREGSLTEASWDEAVSAAAEGLKRLKEKHGGGSLAILAGSHCTNEEAFLLSDFASRVLETNHIASSAYLSGLMGMEETMGYVGTLNAIGDLEEAGAILVIGANPTETAPIVGYSIKRGVRKRQSALMVIDPIEIKLVKYARLWLQPSFESDEFLLLGMIRMLLEDKGQLSGGRLSPPSDADVPNLKEIKRRIKRLSLKDVERKTGVTLESLREVLDILCSADRRALVFGNGVIQQPNGENLVRTLCTLASLIGIFTGKKSMVLPLIKESNALGSIHMGLMNKATPEKILTGITDGSIKGLWVVGEDPMVSFPGASVEEALDKLDFLVVSDSFLSGTGDRADVVFPSASFAEKSGTITNLEGRVQIIRQAIDPVGESRPDWQTIALVAESLGAPYQYTSERDITDEIVKSVPLYSNMNPGEMNNGYFSYKLPFDGGGENPFFVPEEISGVPGTDKKYPYTLMLGSVLFQLGFGHQTKHSPRLGKIVGDEYIEMHPEDAAEENIGEGDLIKLISSTGEKRIKALLSERIPRGMIFLPRPFAWNSSLMPSIGEGGRPCRIKIERITA